MKLTCDLICPTLLSCLIRIPYIDNNSKSWQWGGNRVQWLSAQALDSDLGLNPSSASSCIWQASWPLIIYSTFKPVPMGESQALCQNVVKITGYNHVKALSTMLEIWTLNKSYLLVLVGIPELWIPLCPLLAVWLWANNFIWAIVSSLIRYLAKVGLSLVPAHSTQWITSIIIPGLKEQGRSHISRQLHCQLGLSSS